MGITNAPRPDARCDGSQKHAIGKNLTAAPDRGASCLISSSYTRPRHFFYSASWLSCDRCCTRKIHQEAALKLEAGATLHLSDAAVRLAPALQPPLASTCRQVSLHVGNQATNSELPTNHLDMERACTNTRLVFMCHMAIANNTPLPEYITVRNKKKKKNKTSPLPTV